MIGDGNTMSGKKKIAEYRDGVYGAGQSAELMTILEGYVDRCAVAGAVFVVTDKDRVITANVAGFADIAKRKPMELDSMFWIASQTKPITSTLIMMLVDEGLIDLNAPVETYLPEFKEQWVAVKKTEKQITLKKPKRSIIVADLMRHTSGIPFRSPVEDPTLDKVPLDVAVRSNAMLHLEFEPGEGYTYSNAAFSAAARIAEVMTGKSYATLMEKKLLKPLDMTETTFWPTKKQDKLTAKAYCADEAGTGLVETTTRHLTYPFSAPGRYAMPGGGLFSNADDCAKYCRMILNRGHYKRRRYLSEDALDTMTARQTPASLEQDQGFGLWRGEGRFGHGGALSTNMEFNPGKGLAVIYLVQHTSYANEGQNCFGELKEKAYELFG